MNEIINKIASKFVIFSVVVLFITGLPELFASGTALRIALDKAVVESIPFAKIIIDYVCKIYDYPNNFSTQINYLYECTKLFILSSFYQIINSMLMMLFFKIPANLKDWEAKEKYMDSIGYRLKSFLCSLGIFFLLAIIIENVLVQYKHLFDGIDLSSLMIILFIIGLSIILTIFTKISPISSCIGLFSFKELFIRKILNVFISSLLKTQIISTCSIWAYLSLINDVNGGVISSFITMIVMLILLERAVAFITKCIFKS